MDLIVFRTFRLDTFKYLLRPFDRKALADFIGLP